MQVMVATAAVCSVLHRHIPTPWRQQGYEDTMLAMEHIRKPLAARQALTRSEAVLQKSPGYNGRGRFGTEKRDGPD